MTMIWGWCLSGHHHDCRGKSACPCCQRGHKRSEEVQDA